MSANKLVTCPYDEAHKVKESRLQLHITKCRMNHLTDNEKFICPFNATHVFPLPEGKFHMANCPDRAVVDRRISQSLDKNNPHKGRLAVPSYNESAPIISEEVWDDDTNYSVSGYIRPEPPLGAIVEPPPLSKPAERKRLYQELHRMPTEHENKPPSAPTKPVVINEPKQPSEASKVEMIRKQNVQNYENLGLGRGRGVPTSRIAANIFPPGLEKSSHPPTEMSYSAAITAGMSQLGLGRGQSNQSGAANSIFDDDDDFPALGFGRGITKPPRNGTRNPGARR